MVSARTRRLIARSIPLAAAGGYVLLALALAVTGSRFKMGPVDVSHWLVLAVTGPLALWMGWRWGDARLNAQREEMYRMSYLNPYRGLGKR